MFPVTANTKSYLLESENIKFEKKAEKKECTGVRLGLKGACKTYFHCCSVPYHLFFVLFFFWGGVFNVLVVLYL